MKLRTFITIHRFEHSHELRKTQGGQSRDTYVVLSHVLFSFFARFKVRFTIIFLFFGGFQEFHIVQSTQTRELFLMALKF